jgi:alpha-tubulin suppressor-like RCC1 family protein
VGTSTPRGWLEFGLALRSYGIAFAWGHGHDGQLGNASTADSPVPVKVTGLTQVTGISAGWFVSVATRIDGISAVTSVWTWGNNSVGELGDGTTAKHIRPGTGHGLTIATQVAAGGASSFAVHTVAYPLGS